MECTYRLPEIAAVAADLLKFFPAASCFAFDADMGSGKTTFIRALCTALDVQDAVSSPTFSIINEYRRSDAQPVYHMDWYRLRHAEDAFEAGVQDLLLQPGALCLVEWPGIAPELLPEETVWVRLQAVDEETRLLQAGLRVS